MEQQDEVNGVESGKLKQAETCKKFKLILATIKG